MITKVLFCVLLALPIFSYGQSVNGYLVVEASPKLCQSINRLDVVWPDSRTAKYGLGFHANMGYGRTIPRLGMFAELGVGYASFRQSADANSLKFGLRSNELSYQFDFLQTVFKVGFNHNIPGSKIRLAPYLGFKWLFYLPEEDTRGEGEYKYVPNENLQNTSVVFARYKKGSGGTGHGFAVTGGIRVVIPVNSKVNFSVAPFMDYGLKTIRETSYKTEVMYDHRPNIDYTELNVINKGDALGIEFGLSFQPHK